MSYLHIEFVDGTKETKYIGDGRATAKDGVLTVYGGDGSYRLRGTSESWPLVSIKRYAVNESREDVT